MAIYEVRVRQFIERDNTDGSIILFMNLAGPDLAADIISRDGDVTAPGGFSMNYTRTAILLAGLTGLFMAVGYLIGGSSGP
jgi:hypothetical protein